MDVPEVKKFLEKLDYAVYMTMLCTFQEEGFFKNTVQWEPVSKFQLVYGKYKKYKVIFRWLNALDKEGYLNREEGCYQLAGPYYITSKDKCLIWEDLIRTVNEDICPKKVLEYFYENAKAVKQLITGEENPTWIFFPRAEFTYAEALYSDLLSARYLNTKLSQYISDYIKGIPDPVILEIGAGVGATTQTVLSELNNQCLVVKKYIYTDISKFFLNYARDKFHGYPHMTYEIINVDYIDGALINNGNKLDIIIAVGVLNNCKNINNTLQAILKLIKPGGIFLVIESTVEFSAMLISQVFMMEKTSDQRNEENITFFNYEQWEKNFKNNGFQIVKMEPNEKAVELFGQKLFILKRSTGM
jgi:SAM-dependent methyltransferase